MTAVLPRGIWYETDKKRFRVRRYHNKVAYLKGYYRTFAAAQDALQQLDEELSQIPKLPKRKRGAPGQAPVPHATLHGTVNAIRQRQRFDPNIMRRTRS